MKIWVVTTTLMCENIAAVTTQKYMNMSCCDKHKYEYLWIVMIVAKECELTVMAKRMHVYIMVVK